MIVFQNDRERDLWARVLVKYAGTVSLSGTSPATNADLAVTLMRAREPEPEPRPWRWWRRNP